jgi:hypothetical protein
MPGSQERQEAAIRKAAYLIWLQEGCPEGRARLHWDMAIADHARDQHPAEQRPGHDDQTPDEERILDGRHDVNFPAMLTKDVPGG